MKNNFKGTRGEVINSGGDNNSIDIVMPDDTTISIDRQSRYTGEYVLSREGMESNAQLIVDAFNIRQQINFDLPELLEQRNKVVELLGLLITEKRNMVHPALCVEIEQFLKTIE